MESNATRTGRRISYRTFLGSLPILILLSFFPSCGNTSPNYCTASVPEMKLGPKMKSVPNAHHYVGEYFTHDGNALRHMMLPQVLLNQMDLARLQSSEELSPEDILQVNPSGGKWALKRVILTTRCGARSPTNYGQWGPEDLRSWNFADVNFVRANGKNTYMEISENVNSGWDKLTKLGKEQMIEFGSHLREIYIGNFKFLDPRKAKEQLYVRCTSSPSTMESAQYLLYGLFQDRGIAYNQINIEHGILSTIKIQHNQYTDVDSMDFSFQKHFPEAYKGFHERVKWNYVGEEQMRQKIMDNIAAKVAHLDFNDPDGSATRKLNILKAIGVDGFLDLLSTFYCNGITLPPDLPIREFANLYYEAVKDHIPPNPNVSENEKELLLGQFLSDLLGKQYAVNNEADPVLKKHYLRLNHGLFINDILQDIKSTDQTRLFYIYSGNDRAIVSLLVVLFDMPLGHLPYRANVIIEMWEYQYHKDASIFMSVEHYVRVLYNGKLCRLKNYPKLDPIPLETLVKHLGEYALSKENLVGEFQQTIQRLQQIT